jgi:hypothetical protein
LIHPPHSDEHVAARRARISALVLETAQTRDWSPWYDVGIGSEQADEVADFVLRRWQSRDKRKLGKRDPVTDLARGLLQWGWAEEDRYRSLRGDLQILASVLADELRGEGDL